MEDCYKEDEEDCWHVSHYFGEEIAVETMEAWCQENCLGDYDVFSKPDPSFVRGTHVSFIKHRDYVHFEMFMNDPTHYDWLNDNVPGWAFNEYTGEMFFDSEDDRILYRLKFA